MVGDGDGSMIVLLLLMLLVGSGMADTGTSATMTITANLTCNGTIYAPCPGMPVFDPENNKTVEEWSQ
jgi:hypothetical protein